MREAGGDKEAGHGAEIDSRRKTRAVYDRFGAELSLCLSKPLRDPFLSPCLSFSSSQCLKALSPANRESTRLFRFTRAESLYNTKHVSLLATDT